MVLANPPYSIKKWNREAWQSDLWGRNFLGTPPQGRADYAFFQHILKSLDPKTGRCAILFPHGVLFRNEEAEMRRRLVESDMVECVVGLGANLFYNSPMEACVVICRTRKPAARRGRILFIDAVNEVSRERGASLLTARHQTQIVHAYESFVDDAGFAAVATIDEVIEKQGNLSIPRYVRPIMEVGSSSVAGLRDAWAEFDVASRGFWAQAGAAMEMFCQTAVREGVPRRGHGE